MTKLRFAFLPVLLTAMAGLVAGAALGADADPKKKKAAPAKKSAGRVLSHIFVRDSKDKTWKPASAKANVKFGDLLVGGYGAAITNAKGTVQLTTLGDISGKSPFPIIETAFSLDSPKLSSIDLEFTLDRGRVDILNTKTKGAAKVRVHVQKDTFDLTLSEPETRVALELYGRWLGGVPFKKEPDASYAPHMDMILLVMNGNVDFRAAGEQFRISAPPGPAMIQWDNVHGWDKSPTSQQSLPEWATVADTEEVKLFKQVLGKFRLDVREKGIDATLDEYLASDSKEQRRIAIYVLGATDNLDKIGSILRQAKHADVWENCVRVLRHWIGRGPGQDQILYAKLLENKKLSPVHAETIMQLLHGFSKEQLGQPETYDALVGYLSHDMLGIRGLAHWHLIRVMPAGSKIAYSPLDPPEMRAKAQAEWRKLISSDETKTPPAPIKKP